MIGGILLLDKPLGLSSNAALQKVRRAYGGIKAGHAGTLDPLATGMLPICLGEATKVAGYMLAQRKCYEFTVALGEQRSTGDAEGEQIAEQPVPALSTAAIEAALHALRGERAQVPPMYSAIKQAGQPLYKLARAGLEVARAARQIEIYELTLLDTQSTRLRLRAVCSKGTYIRVLGEELAVALGTVGYIAELRRLWVEPFAGRELTALEAVVAHPGDLQPLPMDSALPHLPAVALESAAAAAIRLGQSVPSLAGPPPSSTGQPQLCRIYGPGAQFLGLGEWRADQRLHPKRLCLAPG